MFFATADDSTVEKQLHSVTRHSVTIGGEVVDYTVTTGTLLLRDIKGEQDLTNFIRSACPER
jgi:carboxypeptidase C (cathepsin A)